jgi:hypothetical protein
MLLCIFIYYLFIKPPKIGEKEMIKYNIHTCTQLQNNKMYTNCHTVHIKKSLQQKPGQGEFNLPFCCNLGSVEGNYCRESIFSKMFCLFAKYVPRFYGITSSLKRKIVISQLYIHGVIYIHAITY